jgi:hypothetical protein
MGTLRGGAALLLVPVVVLAAPGCRRSRLAPRGDGAAVVVRAPTGDDEAAMVLDEKEPNDTFATAMPLSLAGDPLRAAARGRLPLPSGKTGDVDLYKVQLPGEPAGPDAEPPAPRRLVVQVRPEPGVGVSVQLLDADRKALVSTSGGPGEAEGFPNVAVPAGATYFVRVTAAAASGSVPDAGAGGRGYRLLVRLVDFELGDEREPNDRLALATDLGPARDRPEAAGYHGWRRDEDWFRVALDGLPAGAVLDVELEPAGGVVASVAVADATGNRLAAARGRRGERPALRNVAVSAFLPAAGGSRDAGAATPVAFVVVRAENGRDTEQRYALRVRPELPREGTEVEPNDDPRHASPINDGVTMGLLPVGDTDVFRYAPVAPVLLDAELAPPPGVDVKLELLAEKDGRVIARADAGRRHEPERLAAVAVTGPVLLRVSARRGEGRSDEPYQLRLSSRPAADGGSSP